MIGEGGGQIDGQPGRLIGFNGAGVLQQQLVHAQLPGAPDGVPRILSEGGGTVLTVDPVVAVTGNINGSAAGEGEARRCGDEVGGVPGRIEIDAARVIKGAAKGGGGIIVDIEGGAAGDIEIAVGAAVGVAEGAAAGDLAVVQGDGGKTDDGAGVGLDRPSGLIGDGGSVKEQIAATGCFKEA